MKEWEESREVRTIERVEHVKEWMDWSNKLGMEQDESGKELIK